MTKIADLPTAAGMPPEGPWQAIAQDARGGYLSFYHSDPLSPLAVRHVTRRRDNKSDPNVETGTYGLFSTCERGMRNGLVSGRRRWLLFVTNRNGQRCLTGYYRIGWHAPGRPVIAYQGHMDRVLAADEWRFIRKPIPMEKVAESVGDPTLAKRFRLNRKVTEEQAHALVTLLKQDPDATGDHVWEIHRLEALNKRFWGYRYVNWQRKNGFTWDDATGFLSTAGSEHESLPPGYRAAGGRNWTCLDCGNEIQSESPLKQCPECGSVGRQAVREAT